MRPTARPARKDTQTGGNGVSYTVDAEALTDEVLDLEVAKLRR